MSKTVTHFITFKNVPSPYWSDINLKVLIKNHIDLVVTNK